MHALALIAVLALVFLWLPLATAAPPSTTVHVLPATPLALAEELGMRPLQAHCQRGLGTLYARQGQRRQSRAAPAAAIDLYRDMEMTFWLPQTQEALAQLAGES